MCKLMRFSTIELNDKGEVSAYKDYIDMEKYYLGEGEYGYRIRVSDTKTKNVYVNADDLPKNGELRFAHIVNYRNEEGQERKSFWYDSKLPDNLEDEEVIWLVLLKGVKSEYKINTSDTTNTLGYITGEVESNILYRSPGDVADNMIISLRYTSKLKVTSRYIFYRSREKEALRQDGFKIEVRPEINGEIVKVNFKKAGEDINISPFLGTVFKHGKLQSISALTFKDRSYMSVDKASKPTGYYRVFIVNGNIVKLLEVEADSFDATKDYKHLNISLRLDTLGRIYHKLTKIFNMNNKAS